MLLEFWTSLDVALGGWKTWCHCQDLKRMSSCCWNVSDWFGTNEVTLPHILRARQGYLYESAHPGPLIVIIRIYQNRHPGFHPHSRALIPPVCLRWKTKLFGDLMHISGGSTAMPHFLLFHVFIAVSLSSAAALYLIQQSGVPQSVLVSSKQIPRCENIVLRD